MQVICQSINYTDNNFVIILAKKHVHNEKPQNRYPHFSLNSTNLEKNVLSKKEWGLEDTVTMHQGDTDLA